jgi:outer membrane protein assembly factor BamB
MKTFACVTLTATLAVTAALAQDRDLIWSSPAVPPREALDRLNLKLAWSSFVSTEGMRDGIASVQLSGGLLLVQTRSGLVTALGAENGHTLWRTRIGRPYRRPLPLAFNRKGIYAVNGTSLFALDRDTGAKLWEFDLSGGASSPPVAGEYQIYVGFGTSRLSAYLLPQADRSNEALPTTEFANYLRGEEQSAGYPTGTLATQPILAWQALTQARLEFAPVLGAENILFAAPDGLIFGMEKFPVRTRRATERFRYQLTDSPINVPPGHYEDMAYIGSSDSNVYAVNTTSGRTDWRFTTGTAIHRQPIATEKDVYVISERRGLARLNRATGESLWHLPRGGVDFPANREADRFLAANAKFVYAADASGRLLVLDRATGLRLSQYDGIRDFSVPFANEMNDRIYLAANNGHLLCLHDRDYPTPQRHTREDDRAIDPRVAEVEAKLAKQITDPGSEAESVSRALQRLLGEKNGNIKFVISENAFKEAGIAGFEDRRVTIPRVTNAPLGDVLKRVLSSVDANYRVIEDTILIYPLPKKAAP